MARGLGLPPEGLESDLQIWPASNWFSGIVTAAKSQLTFSQLTLYLPKPNLPSPFAREGEKKWATGRKEHEILSSMVPLRPARIELTLTSCLSLIGWGRLLWEERRGWQRELHPGKRTQTLSLCGSFKISKDLLQVYIFLCVGEREFLWEAQFTLRSLCFAVFVKFLFLCLSVCLSLWVCVHLWFSLSP